MLTGRPIRRLAAAALAASLLAPAAQAEDLKIQAMRVNTAWYFFGATLAKLLEPAVPAGTNVEVVPKGGGVGNVIAVSTGRSQMGLANVATAVWGAGGHPVVYQGKTYPNNRALVGGLNSVWFVAMVRKEFMEETGQDDLETILTSGKPVRVSMKPKGSTVPATADMLFASLGISRDDIVGNGGKIIQVAAKQLPDLVRDDRTDVYFESAVRGHPAVTQASQTGKVVFLDLPQRSLDALGAEGLAPKPLPQWFDGQSGPTKAVDFGTVLIANKDMSDDLAYTITKTVCENKDAMVAAHKAWSNFRPEDAWRPEATGVPLHPGAERYYRERGWIR